MIKLPAAWTAQPGRAECSGGYRHFAVLGQRGRGRGRTLELQAVLDPGYRLLVPLAELRDSDAWRPGWQQLPQEQGSRAVSDVAGTIPLESLNSAYSITDL
ncbi:TIGR02450 family Trp-rich protein [Cyanobium sp. AMD-g]|uniref:TIGR02450 family Trp-rich protein n=1 Tax=Cyanobium sp. AMD-g TaxID=2823699 RepID=UPI0020CCA3B7|nr:TIGR02450 family Trp-rich protein [Cyanobium sp. AMD-g]MCP9929926.1 TIGR02450 family Trp-rich protein [Cyanobium sp. AMD-g]